MSEQRLMGAYFILTLLLCSTGRCPGQHPHDHPGDPQRGVQQRDHHQRRRNATQLFLHGLRQLRDPVQETECAAPRRPPQPGAQQHAPQEATAATALLATQDQNP